MVEFLGATGAKVVINPCPMEDAIAWKCAIHAKISIPEININSFKNTQNALDQLKLEDFIETILGLDSDPEVNKYFMKCVERSIYNHEKITYRTFDDPRIREDYYKIILECFKVNIMPFYKGLNSLWNAALKMLPDAHQPQS